MRRIAIFAHYDKDNKVEDYVLYYLNGLRQVADKIIFVSDCDLENEELKKINGLTIFNIASRHGEYDFGSYKRGFEWCTKQGLLESCDELIFANDSCYAPFYPFEEMFEKMQEHKVDFWGVTENLFGLKRVVDQNGKDKVVAFEKPHIQSYFVVMKKRAFTSAGFLHFMDGIEKEDDKIDVIVKYELDLTDCLCEQGFIYATYAKRDAKTQAIHVELWRKLFLARVPFIKTSVLRLINLQSGVFPIGWETDISKHSNYPIEVIEHDLARNKIHVSFFTWIKAIRKWAISVNVRKNKVAICGKNFKIRDK